MPLAAYIRPTVELTIPGTEEKFFLRGLSTNDIAALVQEYHPELTALFGLFQDGQPGGPKLTTHHVEQVGVIAMEMAPKLVSQVIAMAADEPQAVEQAATLPPGFQLECIEKIGKLTLEAEGGLGKIVETVNRIIAGSQNLLLVQRGQKTKAA